MALVNNTAGIISYVYFILITSLMLFSKIKIHQLLFLKQLIYCYFIISLLLVQHYFYSFLAFLLSTRNYKSVICVFHYQVVVYLGF